MQIFKLAKLLFSFRHWRTALENYKTYLIATATLLGLGVAAINDVVIPIIDGADVFATLATGKWILVAMGAALGTITGKAGINREIKKLGSKVAPLFIFALVFFASAPVFAQTAPTVMGSAETIVTWQQFTDIESSSVCFVEHQWEIYHASTTGGYASLTAPQILLDQGIPVCTTDTTGACPVLTCRYVFQMENGIHFFAMKVKARIPSTSTWISSIGFSNEVSKHVVSAPGNVVVIEVK